MAHFLLSGTVTVIALVMLFMVPTWRFGHERIRKATGSGGIILKLQTYFTAIKRTVTLVMLFMVPIWRFGVERIKKTTGSGGIISIFTRNLIEKSSSDRLDTLV